jgi:hypothetical protein
MYSLPVTLPRLVQALINAEKLAHNSKTVNNVVTFNFLMHELQQESSPALTLKDIAPSWHDILVQLPASGIRRMLWQQQLAYPETCIVGEAYGFKWSYVNDCAKCSEFSQTLFRHFKMRSYGALNEGVRSFVAHWNDSHRRETQKTKRRLRWYQAFTRFNDYVLAYRR